MLALYYYPSCGYCAWTLEAIRRLGLADRIELRDIRKNPAYRRELDEARGRTTVPVLRITTATEDVWMPESRDIVKYLTRLVSASEPTRPGL
jgi:glutaredoxin